MQISIRLTEIWKGDIMRAVFQGSHISILAAHSPLFAIAPSLTDGIVLAKKTDNGVFHISSLRTMDFCSTMDAIPSEATDFQNKKLGIVPGTIDFVRTEEDGVRTTEAVHRHNEYARIVRVSGPTGRWGDEILTRVRMGIVTLSQRTSTHGRSSTGKLPVDETEIVIEPRGATLFDAEVEAWPEVRRSMFINAFLGVQNIRDVLKSAFLFMKTHYRTSYGRWQNYLPWASNIHAVADGKDMRVRLRVPGPDVPKGNPANPLNIYKGLPWNDELWISGATVYLLESDNRVFEMALERNETTQNPRFRLTMRPSKHFTGDLLPEPTSILGDSLVTTNWFDATHKFDVRYGDNFRLAAGTDSNDPVRRHLRPVPDPE